ncbi:MAG: beta-glucuronidase [Anaerolineae bacterium]
MLYPQQNDIRNLLDLSGFWAFQPDPAGIGEREGWFNGLPAPRTIAVPASWNEQYSDLRDYLGTAWYGREFYAPAGWRGQRVFVRVGSANYAARAWINGVYVGEHQGGHLPFAFEITDHVAWDRPNFIAIQVDAALTPTRVPPGNVQTGIGGFLRSYPSASFDFFPYAGIQRPVLLYAVPAARIEDVTVVTELDGADGIVKVHVHQIGGDLAGKVVLQGDAASVAAALTFREGAAEAILRVPNARLWGPDDPYLYRLTLTLEEAGRATDRYALDIGIRTIAVDGDKLLLNGRPIFLKGFGKHEDFPVHGRGLNLPLIVKDAGLLRWIGANSYRTSHYPYSEEAMQMADRAGFLIVDETPAVGLFFDDGAEGIAARLAQCKQQVAELIARDKNHPSVIMWSIANEPIVSQGGMAAAMGGPSRLHAAAGPFFTELFELVRRLDPTRLVTVEAPIASGYVDWLALCDVLCIHRYTGWYTLSGQLEAALQSLAKDLDQLHEQYRKPIAITEFGADTIAGAHGEPAEMWTEEYQVEMLRGYLDVAAARPFVVGMHVWNFADFKTGQSILRAGGLNRKGVFTRDRQPKMAAHLLRERWNTKP